MSQGGGWLVLVLLAGILMTGCARRPKKVTQLLSPRPSAPVEVEPAPLPPPPPPPEETPPPAAPEKAVSVPPPARHDWPRDWVPLSRLAEACGFSPPKPITLGTNAGYRLAHARGELKLILGRQPAQWNGTDVWLGFPPRIQNGGPVVHGLDLDKTLLPLTNTVVPGLPPLSSRPRILIDPGHGGTNPGASNVVTGRSEKEYTLDWALRLRPLLEQQGWQVHLTRTNDTDVPLADRVALADQLEAAVFLSLHFNHGNTNHARHGVETYCLTPTGMPSSINRNYPDDPTEVLPNHPYDETNLVLAWRIQHALVHDARVADGGVRRARFMTVLRGQARPALLIEGGYLSNRREARLVGTPEHRQKLAQAVASALAPDAAPPLLARLFHAGTETAQPR